LCLKNEEEINLDAWNEYQTKEKLSSDTKYDVKLKGINFYNQQNQGEATN